MKTETSFREVSRLLDLPNRAAKDCKTVLSCCDKLVKSDINDRCVEKVLAEKSVSQSARVISALNYCNDNDKLSYLNGEISSSALYSRKSNDVPITSQPSDTLVDRAKRMKDDSEEQLTFAMIAGMFRSETNGYLESLDDYISMVDKVTDVKYTRDEALIEIISTFNKVVETITSLKEAIIDKSNIIMEIKMIQ